jgi:hypothetical protein
MKIWFDSAVPSTTATCRPKVRTPVYIHSYIKHRTRRYPQQLLPEQMGRTGNEVRGLLLRLPKRSEFPAETVTAIPCCCSVLALETSEKKPRSSPCRTGLFLHPNSSFQSSFQSSMRPYVRSVDTGIRLHRLAEERKRANWAALNATALSRFKIAFMHDVGRLGPER